MRLSEDAVANDGRPLLASKLSPPRLRQVLARPRLLERAAPGGDVHIVNMCAGPGFGKTTLMAQISRAFDGNSVWYQLDNLDRDPAVFLRHLVAGITSSCSLDPRRTQARLDDTTDFRNESESILAVLMDELHEQSEIPLLICLDDFHLLSENDHTVLLVDSLVRNPPANVSLCIASRTAPQLSLARLRSQGAVCDLSEADLQFSIDELSGLMEAWNIKASTATMQQVYRSTEGWAAGLVLTEDYLRSGDDAPALIRQRRIQQNVYEYLAEEVMRKLPAKTRDFLMQASLLDPIDPAICRQAIDTEDVAALLEAAEESNLFTSRVEGSDMFRFHPLFRDYLSSRLAAEAGPEAVKQLRIRLAKALVKAKKEKDAIDQYLAAGCQDEAVELMEQVGNSLLSCGEHQVLSDWLALLGPDQPSTALLVLNARLLIENGRAIEAKSMLLRAKKALGDEDSGLSHECSLAFAYCLRELNDFSGAANELEQLLVRPIDSHIRLEGLYVLGVIYCAMVNDEGMKRCMRQASEIISSDEKYISAYHVKSVLSLEKFRQGDFPGGCKQLQICLTNEDITLSRRCQYKNNLASGLLLRGMYEEAEMLIKDCLNDAESHKIYKEISPILDTYGCLLLAIGEISRGEDYLSRALSDALSFGYDNFDETPPRYHLGTLARRSSDPEKAHAEHRRALRLAINYGDSYDEAISTVNIGADLMRQGKLVEAESYFLRTMEISERCRFKYPVTHVLFHRAWASLSIEDERSSLNHLVPLFSQAKMFQHNHFIIQEGKISLPLFTLALNNEIEPEYVCYILEKIGDDSLSAVESVLTHKSASIRKKIAVLLGRIGTTGALTLLRRMRYDENDQVSQIVRTNLETIRQSIERTSDLLTPREMEVLIRLSNGETNNKIATNLFISEPTVKTHIATIFRKLGFTNRLEAALYYKTLEKPDKNTTL